MLPPRMLRARVLRDRPEGCRPRLIVLDCGGKVGFGAGLDEIGSFVEGLPQVRDHEVACFGDEPGDRVFVPDIEAAVEDYYRRFQIPEHIVTAHAPSSPTSSTGSTPQRPKNATLTRLNVTCCATNAGNSCKPTTPEPSPSILNTEQDRIGRRLAWLDVQIEASSTEYEQAKAHLYDCLALAGDCHKLYMSIDDSLRRICNQAFFEKIWVKPDSDTVEGEPRQPFNVLSNPEVHTLALDHKAQRSDRRI